MAIKIGLLLATVSALLFFSWPPLVRSSYWRAMITPLASIIGSGFLIIGPILLMAFGFAAPLAMALLCLLAYLFGDAIRYTMAHPPDPKDRVSALTEASARWALAIAYIISVAYYLNLFGAFSVSLTTADTPLNAKLVTSAVYLLIMGIGLRQGFAALERLEQVSVSLKLSIIAGLLISLGIFAVQGASANLPVLVPPQQSFFTSIFLLFGLLVTVQGFETSRYLGETYDAPLRVRTMRAAQWTSTAIYMTYIVGLTFAFSGADIPLSETAIIGMMAKVSPLLPGLLVIAALASQFSAGVADTGGSGGLFAELTKGRLSARRSYLLIGGLGFVLTWTIDIFQIITIASKAFALYYALQAMLAARQAGKYRTWVRTGAYFCLGLLGLAIVLLGVNIAA